jgi:hypothetical protein
MNPVHFTDPSKSGRAIRRANTDTHSIVDTPGGRFRLLRSQCSPEGLYGLAGFTAIGRGDLYSSGLGITVVDADRASRVIMEPALAAAREHFGDGVLQPDGTLDRAALHAIVFADPIERVWLEGLTYPLIGEEIS